MENRSQKAIAWMNGSATLFGVILLIYLIRFVLFRWIVPLVAENDWARYLLTIFFALLWGFLAWRALARDAIAPQTIGLTVSKIPQTVIVLAAGWVVWAGVWALLALPQVRASGQDISLFIGAPADILQQWLFVGVAEELLFRGYLLTRLQCVFSRFTQTWKDWLAVLASGLIFATAHVPVKLSVLGGQGAWFVVLPELMEIFLIGLFFAYFFLRTRNVVLTGLIHGGWNAPLIGKQDVLRLGIFALVVEIWRLFEKRGRKASISAL